MEKKLPVVDTNLLIRFLTNDNQVHADAVESLFNSAEEKSLHIPDVVIVETVFVLLSVYELAKEDVIEKLSILLAYEKFMLDRPLLEKTVEFYGNYGISFIDAYLAALVALERNTFLYTFDKKLLNMGDISAWAPSVD